MSEANALLKSARSETPAAKPQHGEVVEFPHHAPHLGDVETLSEGPRAHRPNERKDFFIERDGERFAGTHLIVDLVGASRLDDLAHIEKTLIRCVEVSKATLLHIHLHHFTPNGGVSGVAVLSESHISIHTWPEADYAALDIFMCGEAEPLNSIAVLKEAFGPSNVRVEELRRGRGMV